MKKEVQKLLPTLPKKLKIGAYNYDIVTLPDYITGDDDRKKWGLCSPSEQKLTLANIEGMPSSEMLVGLLIHEVIHAIWNDRNLKPRETEENIVLAFEVGLVSLFRDNPGLLDWIKKGLK